MADQNKPTERVGIAMPLILRPLRPGDEEAAVRWGADQEFCLAIDWTPNLPAERIRTHWRRIIRIPDPTFLRLGIELNGDLAGYVDLANLDGVSGEFGIAIGEPGQWGRGIGWQAGRYLLQFAFEELGLQSVKAEVHAPNHRSHALMQKLGFRTVGEAPPEFYQGELVRIIRYVINRPLG